MNKVFHAVPEKLVRKLQFGIRDVNDGVIPVRADPVSFPERRL